MAVHTSQREEQLRDSASRIATATESAKNTSKPFRLKGYTGWRLGRVRFGQREGAAIIQLSGQLAEDHLATLQPLADSVTRLDLAVTVHYPRAYATRPHVHYGEALAFAWQRPNAALAHYHEDSRGGSSLQIGDRSSERVLRVYNKEAEQKAVDDPEGAQHYAGCVRYELELKGENAEKVAAELAIDRQRHDTQHGLRPPFDRSGGQALKTGFRRRSDYDSRIRWYSKSVAPSIAVALLQGEACEVLDALGLAHLLQPTVREHLEME
jgi:hypothetical protein